MIADTIMRPSAKAARNRAAIAAAVLAPALLVLSACNSTSVSDGLQPTVQDTRTAGLQQPVRPQGAVGSETALAAQPQAIGAADAVNQQGAEVASLPQNNAAQPPAQRPLPPIAFLPVTGAPQSAVSSLASSMRSAAQANSVPVVISTEQGARFQIKGYFSALKDGGEVVLVYVWDVLDANGNRVHRISGQERGGSASGDPWAGVSNTVIDRVAKITMAGLRSWISTRNAG